VNDRRVTTPTEFYLCMETAKRNGKTVDLLVQNADGRTTDTVTLDLR
jgi:hypothetical protein